MPDALPFVHHRPALARQFADALLGRSPFGYRSGLFLAAPRRTGKSTFLRADLLPALRAEGVRTIYVDLWADRSADPGQLIARALAAELEALQPALGRMAGKVRGLGLGGVSLELAAPDAPGAATLTEALRLIAERSGQTVALVIDEAQQALSTEAGVAAMFALKAARDALNQDEAGVEGARPRLILVFTGSHRDKLSALVLKRDQPFFGADVTAFPLLGPDYVAAYVDWLNARLAEANRFDVADAQAAFALLGSRPELLEQVLRDHAFSRDGAPALGHTVAARAEALRERLWQQYDSDFGSLTPLQRAVMARLIDEGEGMAPFTAETLAAVGAALGGRVTTSDMQSALEALRDKGLIWRSGRGAYAVEDQGMAEWLQARQPD